MDLKYLILNDMSIMQHETQIFKNDIIPPPMIRKKELHSELHDEECLNSSEKNLDEHFEKELNPW